MTRRLVLAGIALAPWCSVAWPATSAASTKIVWHIPTESLPAAKRYLGRTQSEVPETNAATDTRGLPVLMIITAVALLPEIADAIVRVYRNFRYGGVIITTKGGVLDIATDARLPANTFLVAGPNGVKIYEKTNSDADELKGALEALLQTAK